MTPNFICRPVMAFDENPDGSPACIEECSLDNAQWIGVYRENPDHEKTGEVPSVWVFDVEIARFNAPEQAVQVAEGLCELLNAQEALHNPKLHVFFR